MSQETIEAVSVESQELKDLIKEMRRYMLSTGLFLLVAKKEALAEGKVNKATAATVIVEEGIGLLDKIEAFEGAYGLGNGKARKEGN